MEAERIVRRVVVQGEVIGRKRVIMGQGLIESG